MASSAGSASDVTSSGGSLLTTSNVISSSPGMTSDSSMIQFATPAVPSKAYGPVRSGLNRQSRRDEFEAKMSEEEADADDDSERSRESRRAAKPSRAGRSSSARVPSSQGPKRIAQSSAASDPIGSEAQRLAPQIDPITMLSVASLSKPVSKAQRPASRPSQAPRLAWDTCSCSAVLKYFSSG